MYGRGGGGMESTYLFSYFSMKMYVVGTHKKPLSIQYFSVGKKNAFSGAKYNKYYV